MKKRDAARKIWKEHGFELEAIKLDDIRELKQKINAAFESNPDTKGKLSVEEKSVALFRDSDAICQLRCKSDYFDGREALTIYRDGFVGFAGWADDGNVQPILDGFLSWTQALAQELSQDKTEESGPAP